jgi:bifunctional oligoribonuclease and PAP phosphatase NrnA
MRVTTVNSLHEISSLIQTGKHILLTSHILPDGDSIGSLLGLGLALKRTGYRITLFSSDRVPDRYSFLEGAGQIITGQLPDRDYDLVITLDCSDQNRIKPVWDMVKGLDIINIDHHPTNNRFGKLNYVDSRAAATGEIVFQLLKVMGLSPNRTEAEALYVAISTDTGSFKFESTTADTHLVAAQLLEAGVSLPSITPKVFDIRSKTAVCILKEGLNVLKFSEDGKIAWIALTEKEMNQCSARDEDLDGLVNFARNVEGVEVGMLFREKNDGTVKVGFRAQSIDVGRLAARLGGGGHARAAGCSLEMKLGEAVSVVMEAIQKEVGYDGRDN